MIQRLTEITPEVMDGCRNLVGYGCVRDNDEVVIIVDEETDDAVYTQALSAASKEAGANEVYILKSKTPANWFDDPSPFYAEAIKHADVVFCIGGYILYPQPAGLRATSEYGTKIVRVDFRYPWMLATEFSRFPKEVLFAVVEKTVEIVSQGKKLHIRSAQGTDLSCGINPFAISGGHSPKCLPGDRLIFPGGMVGINPQDPVNGTLAMDFIFPTWEPPEVFLPEPLMITIEDRWASRIEGPYADWVERLLETEGDENARWLAEIMWGNHPKAYPLGWPDVRPQDWFVPFHYRPDTLHCALGRGIADFPPFSTIHLDFYMLDPVVEVDGEAIVREGRNVMYDDPEVREIASKYGEPAEVLEVPALPTGFCIR